MKVLTLNIKEDMPPADVAVARLEIEIEAYTKTDVGVIKVIHGYGSHGTGGEIKKLLHNRLNQLKKHGKIKDFIPGEKWSDIVIENKGFVIDFPDLILDSDLKNYNNGITLVFLR
ncbi:MAG: hypothetical protein KBT30_02045 [Clostridiales bacterium]|nr:hypothetical protein [Candidatus Apopatousia equi]